MDAYTVVLYYSYLALDPEKVRAVVKSQTEVCTSLGLKGRVRVSPEGINGCLGGRREDVERYIADMRASPVFAGVEIDFKLGGIDPCREGAGQRMTGLSVKATKEVVSLGADIPATAAPGRHVDPEEFDSLLREGASSDSVVLLDARNRYETAIGHFSAPGVDRIDPDTRQFSDFSKFLERKDAQEKMRGKKVLMYCTGGVRCERASQLVRSLGVAEDVLQLRGGIHRYMEKFPDGGKFAGRNFVFDKRMAVGPPGLERPLRIVGCCALCGSSWDDYTLDCRCTKCRIRILSCPKCKDQPFVCSHCQESKGGEAEGEKRPPQN